MNRFLFNILLALLWGAVSGSFAVGTLAFGFVVGYLTLMLAQPMLGPSAYHSRLWRAAVYLVTFLWDLLKSSIIVARDVMTPGLDAVPAVVAVPLEVKSNVAITLLANTISLTPGTLSLDVSEDQKTLYVHAMYHGDDLDRIRRDIKTLEARVKALVEPDLPEAPVG